MLKALVIAEDDTTDEDKDDSKGITLIVALQQQSNSTLTWYRLNQGTETLAEQHCLATLPLYSNSHWNGYREQFAEKVLVQQHGNVIYVANAKSVYPTITVSLTTLSIADLLNSNPQNKPYPNPEGVQSEVGYYLRQLKLSDRYLVAEGSDENEIWPLKDGKITDGTSVTVSGWDFHLHPNKPWVAVRQKTEQGSDLVIYQLHDNAAEEPTAN